MRRFLSAVVVFTGFVTLLPGQSSQSMRANIRGGGGDNGKCTIEVEVDAVADVEVRGDTGWIRTLEGQPSTWRRFECTSAIPRNPVNFRFKGVDGRGDVRLIRDPSSGGAAVVRINDSKGGREGYTFDLEWSGGGSYSGNDPYYDRRRRDSGPYDDRYNRNRGNYGNSASQAVGMCESAVRDRARRDYGVRDPRFVAADSDDLRGARDRVNGEFVGNRGERYFYSCTVNTNNGRINSVDIRRR